MTDSDVTSSAPATGRRGGASATDGHRWLVPWALASVALGAASLLVPVYLLQLGGGPVHLGVLAAVAALVASPGAVLWGRLADRAESGETVVLTSLAVVAVVLSVVPALSTVASVVVANAILWLAGGAVAPVLTVLVVAGAPGAEWSREIALLNTYQGYGWAGGLLLGGVWTATVGRLLPPVVTQRLLFYGCALVVATAALLLVRWMPTPPRSAFERLLYRRAVRVLVEARRSVHAGSVPFVPTRPYWTDRIPTPGRLAGRFPRTLVAYYAGAALFFGGFAAFFAPLPAFLVDAGFAADAVYWLYFVSGLGAAAFYGPAGELGLRYDLRVLQAGALVVRGASLPLVALAGTVLASSALGLGVAGLLFALVGATWAVVAVTGGTIVARLAPGRSRGEALGVYAALSTLATGVGSVGGGLLARRAGFVATFGVAGALVLGGAAVVATLRGISREAWTAGPAPTAR